MKKRKERGGTIAGMADDKRAGSPHVHFHRRVAVAVAHHNHQTEISGNGSNQGVVVILTTVVVHGVGEVVAGVGQACGASWGECVGVSSAAWEAGNWMAGTRVKGWTGRDGQAVRGGWNLTGQGRRSLDGRWREM